MTTLPVAMAAGIGLFLVFLVFLRWHTSPRAIPAVVLPLAFTPLAFSCLFASRAVINGFRAMAAGEPGALASVLGTMAQANGFVLSTQLATGAVVVLHLAFALILLRREQSSPKPPIANTAGFLSLGSTGLVLLCAFAVSHLLGRSLAVSLGVIAGETESIDERALPMSREALSDFRVGSAPEGALANRLGRYLFGVALGSVVLLPLSAFSFVLGMLVLAKGRHTRAVARAAVATIVLAGLVTGVEIQHHRVLAREIAIAISAME